MSKERRSDKPTTNQKTTIYDNTIDVFRAVEREIKELSKKKPDAIMSAFKVGQINRVLTDLQECLADEPEAKFLDLLDSESLPQVGDAVVVMAQYGAALDGFKERYNLGYSYDYAWWTVEGEEATDDDEEDDEDDHI